MNNGQKTCPDDGICHHNDPNTFTSQYTCQVCGKTKSVTQPVSNRKVGE